MLYSSKTLDPISIKYKFYILALQHGYKNSHTVTLLYYNITIIFTVTVIFNYNYFIEEKVRTYCVTQLRCM